VSRRRAKRVYFPLSVNDRGALLRALALASRGLRADASGCREIGSPLAVKFNAELEQFKELTERLVKASDIVLVREEL
jgi:hypothetical protein